MRKWIASIVGFIILCSSIYFGKYLWREEPYCGTVVVSTIGAKRYKMQTFSDPLFVVKFNTGKTMKINCVSWEMLIDHPEGSEVCVPRRVREMEGHSNGWDCAMWVAPGFIGFCIALLCLPFFQEE